MKYFSCFFFSTCLILSCDLKAKIIPSEVLFSAPTAGGFILSPDASYIVNYEKNTYKTELYITYTETLEKSKILLFEKPTELISVAWVDKDTLLIKYRDVTNSLQQGFVDIVTASNKVNAEFFSITLKDKYDTVYISSLPDVEDKVLIKIDKNEDRKPGKTYIATTRQVLSGKLKKAKEFDNKISSKGYVSYRFNSKGEAEVAHSSYYKDKKMYLDIWVFNQTEKKWRKIYTRAYGDYHTFEVIGELNNGNYAVLTNIESDLITLNEFDIKKKKIVKQIFGHEKYDIADADIDFQRGEISNVQYYDSGQLKTEYLIDESQQMQSQLDKVFPDRQIIISSQAKNTDWMIVYTSASNDAGTYYLFNKSTQKTQKLGEAYQQLKDYKLAKSESMLVKTADNQPIEAILTLPEKSNSVLLVNPHGGPIGVRNFDNFSVHNQYFASRGFSILNINFRGSIGFGKAFQEQGMGEFGKLIEQDITSVVNDLLKNKKRNFNKICSIGSSYGGYSAFMLAIQQPQTYDCIVARYGVYDLPLLFNSSSLELRKNRREAIEKIVGKESDISREYSPFHIAEKVTQPVLMTAGTKDFIAYVEHTKRMQYRLSELSKDVETVYYQDVGHGHSAWSGESYDWLGDRHELAVIYEFLRRKLELPEPEVANYKQVIKHESLMLADSYIEDDFVENDYRKAIHFLTIAADLGSTESMYKIARLYHQEKQATQAERVDQRKIDKHLNLAINWYQKASQLGYADASLALADIFEEQQQLKQSFDYLKLAVEQENQIENLAKNNRKADGMINLQLARAYCLGLGTTKDIPRCFSLIKQTQVSSKQGSLKITNIINEMIWSDSLSTEDKNQIMRGLQQNLGVPVKNCVREYFEVAKHGYYIEKIKKRKKRYGTALLEVENAKIKFKKDTNKIPLAEEAVYGLNYKISSGQEKNASNNAKYLIKYKLTHPAIDNPNSAEKQFNDISTETYRFLIIDNDEQQDLYFKLNNPAMRVAGKWKLEIFNLDNELLYSREFELYRKK